MANSYPPFSKGGFTQFNPNLAVVDFYLGAKDAFDKMTVAGQEYDAVAFDLDISDHRFFNELVGILKDMTTPATPPTSGDVDNRIKQSIEMMKHANKISANRNMADRERRDAALMLLPLFCVFDDTAMEKAGKAILDQGKKLVDQKAVLSGQKGQANKKFKEATKDWKRIYNNPTFLDRYDEAQRPMEAFKSAKNFVDTWAMRAKCFEVPVTVECTMINTLAQQRRQLWSKAYMDLGFDKLKHEARYIPYRAEPELQQNIPVLEVASESV